MKKRILSFVSVCLLIASLTTSAFASYNASNVEIEARSNKTNVTVDALLDFIYSKGGREAPIQKCSKSLIKLMRLMP